MKFKMIYSGYLIDQKTNKMIYFKTQKNALIIGKLLSKHYGNLWAIRKRKFNIFQPLRLKYYLVFDVISDERCLSKSQIRNILNQLKFKTN